MSAEQKIMTVSYGTFSCTLEGFDDPFETMKAMAEYFRDLTANDRYFGAEPPQPDTEKLQHIAEATLQHPVETEMSSPRNLVLRKSDEEQTTTMDPFAAAIAAKAVRTQATAEQPAQDISIVEDTPPNADEVFTKLTRVRDAIAKGDTAENAPTHADQISQFIGSAQTEDHTGFYAEGFDVSEYDEDPETVQSPDSLPQQPQTASDEPTSNGYDNAFVEEISEEELTQAYAELDTSDDDQGAPIDAVATVSDEVNADMPHEDADVEFVKDAEIDETQITDTQDVGALEVADDDTNQKPTPLTVVSPDAASKPVSQVAGLDAPSPDFEDFSKSFAGEEHSADNDFTFSEEILTPAEADGEVAMHEDNSEADTPESDISEPNRKDTDDVMAKDKTEHRADRLTRRDGTTLDEDAAIERLMDATSSRLQDSENSGRRASIAHLKAAVAATKADSSIAKNAAAQDAAELDQYREDLAMVVRPGQDTDKTSDVLAMPKGPSPLVLVGEQRVANDDSTVDPKDALPADHQVDMREDHGNSDDLQDNIFSSGTDETFQDFAARMNAVELTDMLEAAAAHSCLVEGMKTFSRPLLMRKIAMIDGPETTSREDALRSFGTLLRQGKIIKDEDGRFTIANTSQFLNMSEDIAANGQS